MRSSGADVLPRIRRLLMVCLFKLNSCMHMSYERMNTQHVRFVYKNASISASDTVACVCTSVRVRMCMFDLLPRVRGLRSTALPCFCSSSRECRDSSDDALRLRVAGPRACDLDQCCSIQRDDLFRGQRRVQHGCRRVVWYASVHKAGM